MSLIRDLELLPVWVSPDHLAITAVHIMEGHKINVVAVLEGGQLLGSVTKDQATSVRPQTPIRQIMRSEPVTVSGDDDVRAVASSFVQDSLSYAFVLDGGVFTGIVTPTLLLRELGRSYDPLTGLPWSDYLREWGIEHLTEGEEITVLFIDLDQFGQFNKEYGHIVGDRVLQRVSSYLRDLLNPDTDILVRYGGDEFAIGTLRRRDEAEQLAEELRSAAGLIPIEGAPRPISFSVGIHGGRRVRERENIHYGATLDNLINIASRNCQSEKSSRVKADAPPASAAKKTCRVISIHADPSAERGVTTVILSFDGAVSSGADPRGDQAVIYSVAVATAKALERAIPGSSLTVDKVEVEGEEGSQTTRVSAKASFNGKSSAISAEVPVEADLYRSVVEALIEATVAGRSAA